MTEKDWDDIDYPCDNCERKVGLRLCAHGKMQTGYIACIKNKRYGRDCQ